MQNGNSVLLSGLQLSTSYFMEPTDETSIRKPNLRFTKDRILNDGFKIGGVGGHAVANGKSLVSCCRSILNIRELVYIVLHPHALRALIIILLNKTVIVKWLLCGQGREELVLAQWMEKPEQSVWTSMTRIYRVQRMCLEDLVKPCRVSSYIIRLTSMRSSFLLSVANSVRNLWWLLHIRGYINLS